MGILDSIIGLFRSPEDIGALEAAPAKPEDVRAALKTAVLDDAISARLAADAEDGKVADYLNDTPAELFVVWRTRVTAEELLGAYVWPELDSLTAARHNALSLLLARGAIDPSQANVRAAIENIFAGGALSGTRAAILALCKRGATRAERVLADGAGTDAEPATMAHEGLLTASAVSTILRG